MRYFYFIILCFIIVGNIHAQWTQDLDAIIQSPELSNTQVAVQVLSADGKELYSNNGAVAMIPASTLKLVTGLSFVDVKGADFRYVTKVYLDGSINQEQILEGDLLIKASGDPSLGAYRQEGVTRYQAVLDQIVTAVQSKVACINGDIIIDASVFGEEAVHPGWAWDDLSNYYATGVWGLNFHQNLYYLTFGRTNKVGASTTIESIEPKVHGLSMNNQVALGKKGSGDQAYIYGSPYSVDKSVTGTIPPGTSDFTIKGAVPDSRLWFATLLKEQLESLGINVNGITITNSDSNRTYKEEALLLLLASPTATDMVAYALAVSDNLYCDAFYKTIGAQYSEIGTWASGRNGVENHLKRLKLNLEGYHQEDGSGLTMRNRISADFLTSFLQKEYQSIGREGMLQLLPKAGKDGSLKNFLKGRAAQDAVWAKSGSVNGVLAYAGIISDSKGPPLFFSLNVNGHQTSNSVIRKKMEAMLDVIYKGNIVD